MKKFFLRRGFLLDNLCKRYSCFFLSVQFDKFRYSAPSHFLLLPDQFLQMNSLHPSRTVTVVLSATLGLTAIAVMIRYFYVLYFGLAFSCLLLLLIWLLVRGWQPRKVSAELSREADLSDSIINSLPGIFYLYDRNGKFLRWNKNFETVSGYTGKEISSMHPLQFLSDQELSKNKIASVFQNGSDEMECGFVTKEGKEIPYFFNGSLITVNGQQFLIGMGIDISSRKQAEQKIRDIHKEHQTTLNRISDAVIALDLQWKYTFLNDAALNSHPLGREKTIGKSILDVHPGIDNTIFWRTYLKALQTMNVQEAEGYYEPFGVWFSIKVYPSSDGLTIFYRNITEKKQTEQEMLALIDSLQAKNNDLQQFSYIVSHNLRAPVAKITGLASIIGEDDEQNKTVARLMAQEAHNLDEVVKDINTIVYARKSVADRMEQVTLKEELEKIKQVLSMEIEESNALITDNFAEAPTVVAMKSYLYSILYNLVSNAIKYRSNHAQTIIQVRSEATDKFFCLSVSDNGVGIDLKTNGDQLFRLYKRLHDSSIPGRGVGLNLVKTHAESMGGRVEVDSQLHQGSVFRVYLPL